MLLGRLAPRGASGWHGGAAFVYFLRSQELMLVEGFSRGVIASAGSSTFDLTSFLQTQGTQWQCPADGHLSSVKKAAGGWLLSQSVGSTRPPGSR